MYFNARVDDVFGFGSLSRGLATNWGIDDAILRGLRIGEEGFLRDNAVGGDTLAWLDGFGTGLINSGLINAGVNAGIVSSGLPYSPVDVRIAPDSGPVAVMEGLAKEQRVADPGIAKGENDAPVDPSPTADTVPADVSSTATIALGGSVNVIVETLGDHDWFKVSLVAGVTYTIQTSNDGSGTDAFLNLRNAAGTILASDDDSGDGVNSLISFTATTTGNYFIDAGTYNNETTGSYNLFIAPAFAGGDVGGTIGTASTLAVGGTVNGNIEVNGDRDYYAINLVAGQTYIFRTAPTSTPTNTTDTTLTLRDAAGTQLLTNDDAGEFGFSAIRFTATATGTYYLDVGGFGTSTGAFNLSAFTAPTPVVFTTDQIANQLTNGYWGGAQHRFNVSAGGSLTYNVVGLTVDGANLARAALALWSDFTGITFNEVGTGGQIVFDDNQTGAFANSVYSGGITSSATVNVGTAWIATYGTGLNTYSFQTYIHEIGHALGLGHAGNYNGSADYSSDSLYLNDSWATTIMSYFDQNENSYFQQQGFTRQFVVSPGYADAVAIANLYGNSTTVRTGDTVYGFNNTSGRDIYNAALYPSVTYTITDDGGIDTLDYSGFSSNQRINLNAETFSSIGLRVGNVTIARGTAIENAIGGSGNDTLTGNALDNALSGGGGNDFIYGGGGNDVIDGGTGANELYGEDGNDRIIVRASGSIVDGGTGTDTLEIVGSVAAIVGIAGFEALALTGGAAVTFTGAQITNGFSFNSVLSGTGSIIVNLAATDYPFAMSGMTVAGGSNLAITINGTASDDYVKGVLNATNTLIGGDGFDFLRGGLLNDVINGGNGNDKITGWLGADTLTGGAGADQFRFFTAGDSGFGAARDVITDFVIGTDFLDFRLLDPDPVTPGYQHFSFIGTAAFVNNGTAQLRYFGSGADLLLQVDADGNGVADMEIVLQGLNGQTLTGGDFLL